MSPRLPLLAALTIVLATSASGNDRSYYVLQSGVHFGPTPIHDHGLRGEGQIIALLDTGLDYDSCYFAEADNSPPPVNTGTPNGPLQTDRVDISRRKVIAYDFLFSCDQYPGQPGCDHPDDPLAWDNTTHGTHTAASAAADTAEFLFHDIGDSIAPGAKLVIQDAGYNGGDNCSQLPGLGCPVRNFTAALEQAYAQGARIHSNSWGDRQGTPMSATPPTGNYSATARDLDEFALTHPDMLIVVATGNAGALGASSIASPGTAKNALQVGGTRNTRGAGDDTLAPITGLGPTRDGRIKPEVVGPAWVYAATSDGDIRTGNCRAGNDGGTSYAAPTIAGAAALVRQYFLEGFYPSGFPTRAVERIPSAALLKASLIASARAAQFKDIGSAIVSALPTPSYEQGWGFPVLDDVLYFPGDRRRLKVVDVDRNDGLINGDSSTISLRVRPGTSLRAVLVWTDPPSTARTVSDSSSVLVHDLDLKVIDPAGGTVYGNEPLHPGQADRKNNTEVVTLAAPAAGTYRVTVSAQRVTGLLRQGYALVVTGDFDEVSTAPPRRRAARR